ncbi:hypothetical protein G210_0513 [Candida maltosa Xu316]|uniref:Uncharacterized protein n=1 Tax=Candida maltosa (strain Xu316) TaxID=1245528 RepID=M3J9P7_CANMX|nr:hypothetical protein G210_0513 [Candida maltosa Xu316]
MSSGQNTIAAHTRIDSRSTDTNYTKIVTFTDDSKLPTSIPFLNHLSQRQPQHQHQQPPQTTDNILDIDSLGKKLVNRLLSLGILSSSFILNENLSDVSSASISDTESENSRKRPRSSNESEKSRKRYNCKMDLELNQNDKKYNVRLRLVYESKSSTNLISNGTSTSTNHGDFDTTPYNLYVTYDELINYLRDKIFLTDRNRNLHGIESKINILLRLKVFKCFINGQEFDASKCLKDDN